MCAPDVTVQECSAVKPIPPCTCWVCRQVISAARPAAALASSARSSESSWGTVGVRVQVDGGRSQGGFGAFDGDQGFGQTVADRLEGCDRFCRTGCGRGRGCGRA